MKKYLVTGAVLIVAALAGWNFQQNRSKVVLSDVALVNVEALALELSEVTITCSTGGNGSCYKMNGGEVNPSGCHFTGKPYDFCYYG